jgi:hypothetical protein
LLELSKVGGIDIRVECPDGVPSSSHLPGREATPPACHVSPTPEGASVHEGASAPVGASAPKGAAEDDPAPEGPGTGSPSVFSMDIHVGSPMVRFNEVVVMGSDLLVSPAGLATLVVSGHGTEDPMGAPRVENPMGATLSLDYPLPLVPSSVPDAASNNVFPFDSTSIPSALGFPSFISDLQVCTSLLYLAFVRGCFLCWLLHL